MRAGIVYVMFTIKSYYKKPPTVPDRGGGFSVSLMGHGKETGFHAENTEMILKGFKQRSFVIRLMLCVCGVFFKGSPMHSALN